MTADERRLARLAERHGPRVLAYLRRRTSSHDDAADVFQLVLEVTWRRLGRVPADDEQALAWMLATARRCLANHRRGALRRSEATERLAHQLSTASAVSEEPDDVLMDALGELGADDRELLTLVYWEDLSLDQAADVLGIRPAAARKRLQRARERLGARLTGHTRTNNSAPPEARALAPR